jgi:hypothetical protein
MKDLIIVSSYCDTKQKEDILRNLVNQCYKENSFDLMVVSHTTIPDDISKKTTLSLYDSKNELLYDWDLRSKPWFNPGNEREIQSIFTGFFNSHLAIWRMIILGNSVAKNLGYKKVHHIEYDCDIKDFTEIYDNSKLLDTYDCITYTKIIDTIDNILFGTYQAYRLDTLHDELLILDEEKLKSQIRVSNTKSPEGMLFNLLHTNKKGFVKNKSLLDINNNFGLSHTQNIHTAWCLPYYDRLTNKLSFIIWNVEEHSRDIDVKLIYNDDKIINFNEIKHSHWVVKDIDDYKNAKKLTVILNGKIRNEYDFEKDGELFKQVSYRKEFNR